MISSSLTDCKPTVAPLIAIVTPLSSIGKFGRWSNEPVAVRATIGWSDANRIVASIPGESPSTEAGVTPGVPEGEGDGDGDGVGEGDGEGEGDGDGDAPGEGVGVGDVECTGSALAPVKNVTTCDVSVSSLGRYR